MHPLKKKHHAHVTVPVYETHMHIVSTLFCINTVNVYLHVCVSHLEHQATHAKDHPQQVHVVGGRVLQGGIRICAGEFIPETNKNLIKSRV